MADLSTWLRTHDWKTISFFGSDPSDPRIIRTLNERDFAAQAAAFLARYGFTDLTLLGNGNDAVVFADTQNPDLVIRLTPGADLRPVRPQILQPIHTELIGGGRSKLTADIRIEFLRNIAAETIPPALIGAYRQEVTASGYKLDSHQPEEDGGLFTYHDPKSGTQKTVFMGADASILERDEMAMIQRDKPHLFPNDMPPPEQPPTCTENYPTLEIQWLEQCRMVEADPRLKNMIGGLPPKLPLTRVIPAVAIGPNSWVR